MFTIKVESNDLRRLSRQLRQHGDSKAIRRDLTRGLRLGAQPALQAAKAAARGLPDAPGGSSSGFRRRTAAATMLSVRTSGRPRVAVRVSRARMGDQASLVRATNKGYWRHPVFGDRDVWVAQRSRPRWFDSAVSSEARAVRRELSRVVNDIERRMAHG